MHHENITIFWLRRDLRLSDNAGLFHALRENKKVLLLFIFDKNILKDLPENDARVSFIYKRLHELKKHIEKNFQSSIAIYHETPLNAFKKLSEKHTIKNVYTNSDYEPYALKRDTEIKSFLKEKNVEFYIYKDQVIFEKKEVVKDDGTPYLVYTPYMKKWKALFNKNKDSKVYETSHFLYNLHKTNNLPDLTLTQLGFVKSNIPVPSHNTELPLLDDYHKTRNFPSKKGTSFIGPHLRFGTIGIRNIVQKALKANAPTFLNELIWREFFMQILYHFPETITESFKKKYDRIEWVNDESLFEHWKQGVTGYPLVDAGMRELKQTGFMHNRVRMVAASFLCKHLLIDWRWGEAYFAEKLLDYELASNLGNWQWVAGCGVDAAPYFRIFNPSTQLQKFDKNQDYIKKWIPEYGTDNYPDEIVNHKEARARCLNTYKRALNT